MSEQFESRWVTANYMPITFNPLQNFEDTFVVFILVLRGLTFSIFINVENEKIRKILRLLINNNYYLLPMVLHDHITFTNLTKRLVIVR